MRGRDDAHVDAHGLGAADRHERALLQHAQQLHLQRGGHVADFVEKERTAIRGLEQAFLIFHRAGERAALMTEKRALEQVVVECRAVLNDERLLRAWPVIVDGARDQLFAGAALAVNEHGRFALHDLREELHHFAHCRRITDDLGERMRPGGRRNDRGLRALAGACGGCHEVRDPCDREVIESRHGRGHRRGFGRDAGYRGDRLLEGRRVDLIAATGRVHEPGRLAIPSAHRARDDRQAGMIAMHDRDLGGTGERCGFAHRARVVGADLHDRLRRQVRRAVGAIAVSLGEAELEAPPATQ